MKDKRRVHPPFRFLWAFVIGLCVLGLAVEGKSGSGVGGTFPLWWWTKSILEVLMLMSSPRLVCSFKGLICTVFNFRSRRPASGGLQLGRY